MKNVLDYYYGIKVDDIHRINNTYTFELQGYEHTFFEYIGDLNQANIIYNFSMQLNNYGIYCHQIILNKDKKLETYLNGKTYILMRYYDGLKRRVSLEDIVLINTIKIRDNKLDHSNWKKMWESKIDYFEYQLSNFGNKHPLLRNSFNYFSGFVETSIQILNSIDTNNSDLVLSHKRIKYDSTLFDLYNPFNFSIDYKVRDFCEYIKNIIFQKKNTYSLLELEQITYTYIINNNLSTKDVQLLFVRFLYPSPYFDIFEDFIISEIEDCSNHIINSLLENAEDYEQFIINIYNYLFNKNYLPYIEWLKIA